MSEYAPRRPEDSTVEMTELILPQHTNAMGTCFGGQILSWIDIAAGICAGRHARCTAVTVAFDDVHFVTPIRLGDVVSIRARVTWVGRTSMEVWVDVQRSRYDSVPEHANTAYVTFVAVDSDRKPRAVPPLLVTSDEDQARWTQAEERRRVRLARAQRT